MSDEVQARLEALERRVLALEQRAGFSSPGAGAAGADDEVIALLNSGNKIEAIKVYRERTGLGLKEAKDAVDAIEQRYRL